jgi:hypothetical protein
LRGEPRTPEFVHSYNEAIATRAATPQGKLLSVSPSNGRNNVRMNELPKKR